MLKPLPILLGASLNIAWAATPSTCPQYATAKINGSGQTLRYCVIDGQALLGDIILGDHATIQRQGLPPQEVRDWRRAEQDQRRDGAKRRGKRQAQYNYHGWSWAPTTWPQNTVVYAFERSATPRARSVIQQAIAQIEAQTHVRFKERVNESAYVRIESRPPEMDSKGAIIACGRSMLGRTGGPQMLWVGSSHNCETVTLARHELQHALGFEHGEIENGHDGLSPREVAHINQRYPASDLPRHTVSVRPLGIVDQPKAQLSTRNLTIDQHGLGRVQLYVDHPGTRLSAMTWTDSSGQPVAIRTTPSRVSQTVYTLMIQPGSFSGAATLQLTLTDAQGRTGQTSLALQVAPNRRSVPPGPVGTPQAEARQLVARFGENLCLQAPPALRADTRLRASPCRPGEATQQWRQNRHKQLESIAHTGYCLAPSSYNASATLAPCHQGAADQQWQFRQDGRLANGIAQNGFLSICGSNGLLLYPSTPRATWQQWDWR